MPGDGKPQRGGVARKISLSLCLCVSAAPIASTQVTGDECLFCHRNDIGPGWRKNRHALTIREREDAPELAANAPPEAGYFLGSRQHIRYLKLLGYGKFAILSDSGWDPAKFGDRCAGCHASGVDPASRTCSAFSLDCYMCHGDVDLEHSRDTSLVWLSRKRRGDARAVVSTCAGCHLRGGRSRSTGLPYPVRGVPGEDLFRDWEAGWKRADDPALNPGDRHIWRSARDVIAGAAAAVTCLNCHQVHAGSSAKHRRVLRSPICEECHNAAGPMKAVKTWKAASDVCEVR